MPQRSICRSPERIAAQEKWKKQKASLGVSSLLVEESEVFHERAIGILSERVEKEKCPKREIIPVCIR